MLNQGHEKHSPKNQNLMLHPDGYELSLRREIWSEREREREIKVDAYANWREAIWGWFEIENEEKIEANQGLHEWGFRFAILVWKEGSWLSNFWAFWWVIIFFYSTSLCAPIRQLISA